MADLEKLRFAYEQSAQLFGSVILPLCDRRIQGCSGLPGNGDFAYINPHLILPTTLDKDGGLICFHALYSVFLLPATRDIDRGPCGPAGRFLGGIMVVSI